MRTETLFDRHIRHHPFLGPRYRSTSQLPLAGRTVLRQLFDVACASAEPGIYRPDVARDGEQPLPYHVARAIDAADGEAVISEMLPIIARLDFIKITTDGCIVFDYLLPKAGRGQGGGRGAQPGVRIGGAKGGRPPKGETAETIYAKREREQQQQPSFMLPIMGGFVAAEQVADRLAAPLQTFAMAAGAETDPETVRVSETEAGSVFTSSSGSSLGSLPLDKEEEEDERGNQLESLENHSSSSSSPASANAKLPQTETAKPNPETEAASIRKPSKISQAAKDLANRYRERWPDAPGLVDAARVFQDRLDEGWTGEQLVAAVDISHKPRIGPSYYTSVLNKLFHGPGLERRKEDAASLPAASSVPRPAVEPAPTTLGPPWDERWGKFRGALRREFTATEYSNYLALMVLVAVDDDVATVNLPSTFLANHVRNNFGHRLAAILTSTVPELSLIRFGSAPPALAQTG